MLIHRYSSRGSSLHVELVDSLEALERHATAFDDLTARADGTVFPAFQRRWIESGRSIYLKDPRALFLLLAWRGDRLVGIAPLHRERRWIGIADVIWLGFWGQSTGINQLDSFTGDFILPDPSERTHCLMAFRQVLSGLLRRKWDFLELRYFCDISPNVDAFRTVFPEAVVSPEVDAMRGYLVELPHSPELVGSLFGGKTMRNLRRSMRLLSESGLPHRFEVLETLNSALFDEISTVHTSRQATLVESGREDRDALLSNPTVREIVMSLLLGAAEERRLRIHTLRIEERLAAFAIVLANGADAVCWLIAFDGAYQQFSPSRLVFERMYQTEVATYGTRRINLMPGFTRTKKELSTTEYQAYRFAIVNNWSTSSRATRWVYRQGKTLWQQLRARRDTRSPPAEALSGDMQKALDGQG